MVIFGGLNLKADERTEQISVSFRLAQGRDTELKTQINPNGERWKIKGGWLIDQTNQHQKDH